MGRFKHEDVVVTNQGPHYKSFVAPTRQIRTRQVEAGHHVASRVVLTAFQVLSLGLREEPPQQYSVCGPPGTVDTIAPFPSCRYSRRSPFWLIELSFPRYGREKRACMKFAKSRSRLTTQPVSSRLAQNWATHHNLRQSEMKKHFF